jgi:transcriptional regulator with XRE-family HTH domain
MFNNAYMNKLLRENLIFLQEFKEIHPTDAAKQAGLNQPTVHRIFTGESKNPRQGNITKLASVYGVSFYALTEIDLSKFFSKNGSLDNLPGYAEKEPFDEILSSASPGISSLIEELVKLDKQGLVSDELANALKLVCRSFAPNKRADSGDKLLKYLNKD